MMRLEVLHNITAADNMEIIATTVASVLGLCSFDPLLAPDEWYAGRGIC